MTANDFCNNNRVPLFGGGDLFSSPKPELLTVSSEVRGLRLRIELTDTNPLVWRHIDIASDILLPRLHAVIQGAMGWDDSHLHCFRTGNEANPPRFITQFDRREGDWGMPEDDVRLDQIVATKGDRFWYDYDFGDNWTHVLEVEQILSAAPADPTCVDGSLACPPEDCGGVWGYQELSDWVRNGFDQDSLPTGFESVTEARNWLPDGWHPDTFSVNDANDRIALFTAEPIPLAEGLRALLDEERQRGAQELFETLTRPAIFDPWDVDTEGAARLTKSLWVLLDVIGDGLTLTAAGKLKPADVQQIAQRTGVHHWWIGKGNREDLTTPVANLRSTAQALGLLLVRNGRLSPTTATKRLAGNPETMVKHVVGRLPLGTKLFDQQAGWAALAVAASEAPLEEWNQRISEILHGLGWHNTGDGDRLVPARSPTLIALMILSGWASEARITTGVNPDIAALARATLRG